MRRHPRRDYFRRPQQWRNRVTCRVFAAGYRWAHPRRYGWRRDVIYAASQNGIMAAWLLLRRAEG